MGEGRIELGQGGRGSLFRLATFPKQRELLRELMEGGLVCVMDWAAL